MKIFFETFGDHSVGITGDFATLEIDVSYLDKEDANDLVASIKSEVSKALNEVWNNGKVTSYADYEVELEEAMYDTEKA